MAYSKIQNLWESVSGLLVSQYRNATNLKKLMEINANSFSSIEDSSDFFSKVLDIDNISGIWLDIVASIKNIYRISGETDSAFRTRMKGLFNVDYAGTEKYVLSNVKQITGDTSPLYIDEAPATFFVYTPNPTTRQMTRAEIKKLAPAGVLGLPGAAIQTATGDFIGDYSGDKFLAVAENVVS